MPILCGLDGIYCGNTTPEITLFTPVIKSVLLSPNPVDQNTALAIIADVSEIDIGVASAVIIYTGTLNCNQEVI